MKIKFITGQIDEPFFLAFSKVYDIIGDFSYKVLTFRKDNLSHSDEYHKINLHEFKGFYMRMSKEYCINLMIKSTDESSYNIELWLQLKDNDLIEIFFNIGNDNLTNDQCNTFNTFFFNLYKSLPNGLGYVSWVDVGNQFGFLEKHNFFDNMVKANPFNRKVFFYHCVSIPETFKKYYTKDQLLHCPFIKVEEWEDGSIEMLHYNNPLEIESEENIEQIRRVRKYLSENNLYS